MAKRGAKMLNALQMLKTMALEKCLTLVFLFHSQKYCQYKNQLSGAQLLMDSVYKLSAIFGSFGRKKG